MSRISESWEDLIFYNPERKTLSTAFYVGALAALTDSITQPTEKIVQELNNLIQEINKSSD